MTRVTTTLRMIVYLDCNGYCIDSDVWVTDKEREELIKKEMAVITNPKVREKAQEYIDKIHEGNRDFRF